MTDAFPVQIINQQRNSNTILQNSTLQSTESLNKIHSVQNLRTIKGTATLSNTNGNSDVDVCVINDYDGSPIQLHPNDIVLTTVIYNGNIAFTSPNSFTGSLYRCKYSIPFQYPGSFRLCITPTPIYSDLHQMWIPDTSIFTNISSLTPLYALNVQGVNGVYVPVGLSAPCLYQSAIGSINNNSQTSYNGNCRALTCRFTYMSTPILNLENYGINQIVPTVSINITLLVLNPSF